MTLFLASRRQGRDPSRSDADCHWQLCRVKAASDQHLLDSQHPFGSHLMRLLCLLPCGCRGDESRGRAALLVGSSIDVMN
jgi:hypothetical protein